MLFITFIVKRRVGDIQAFVLHNLGKMFLELGIVQFAGKREMYDYIAEPSMSWTRQQHVFQMLWRCNRLP